MARQVDWTHELAEQLEWHWREQLRPRFDGLADAEYLWEPTDDCWNVRPRGTSTAPVQAGGGAFTLDYASPAPEPAPVTTIAWRLCHVIVGVFGTRTAAHFGGSAVDYESFEYPGTADEALGLLDDAHRSWARGVRGLGPEDLARPCGPAEGPYADYPMAALVLHIHREAIHHGAEISLLRDLYTRLGRDRAS
ncbi:MAG: DinB family protein [Segniliparus sp.]|uniref:DinB family protein n=1 Tax=Segniliparus sp. TaxID=2804064 RepID=UPI003F2F4D8B